MKNLRKVLVRRYNNHLNMKIDPLYFVIGMIIGATIDPLYFVIGMIIGATITWLALR